MPRFFYLGYFGLTLQKKHMRQLESALLSLLFFLFGFGTLNASIAAHPGDVTAQKDEAQLIHFWFFGGDLPNDTPLEQIGPTFQLVGGSMISYHSALDGYPFDPEHPNWRKASLERRNVPTALNYLPQGNGWIPYEQSGMRGIQVRQPFTGDGGENTLYLHIPTTGHEDIVVRFAAKDQGDSDELMAAEELLIDYSPGGNGSWTTEGLEETSLALLHETYQVYEISLSQVESANDNPDLVLRIRFDGPDMDLDQGDRVAFNNISVEGIPYEAPESYTVTFIIQDQAGAPIPNAVITLGSVTNEMGDYVFGEVLPGQYTYVVAALGYEEATGSLTVQDADLSHTVVLVEEPDDIPGELVHFWFFGGELPNDTPLEQIAPTFHQVDNAMISYHSALEGYPFDENHPSWRKASLERRNRPTEINYRPEGNQGISFEDSGMRGIQVRQPFIGDAGENTLILHLPSTGYMNPVITFAAKDNGESEALMAAEDLVIDYATGENGPWVSTGLANPVLPLLFETYQLYQLDFSGIQAVNNNPHFRLRIRFDGPNLDLEEGDRVVFNNIAMDADVLDETGITETVAPPVFDLYPNPASQQVMIQSDEGGLVITLYDLQGKALYRHPMEGQQHIVSTGHLSPGAYILRATSTQTGQSVSQRLIIQ